MIDYFYCKNADGSFDLYAKDSNTKLKITGIFLNGDREFASDVFSTAKESLSGKNSCCYKNKVFIVSDDEWYQRKN